jgi:hypothetical protein
MTTYIILRIKCTSRGITGFWGLGLQFGLREQIIVQKNIKLSGVLDHPGLLEDLGYFRTIARSDFENKVQ